MRPATYCDLSDKSELSLLLGLNDTVPLRCPLDGTTSGDRSMNDGDLRHTTARGVPVWFLMVTVPPGEAGRTPRGRDHQPVALAPRGGVLRALGRGDAMNDVSGKGGLSDYRAIGKDIAIMPTVSVVIPAK